MKLVLTFQITKDKLWLFSCHQMLKPQLSSLRPRHKSFLGHQSHDEDIKFFWVTKAMFVKFSRPPKPGLSRFQATKATLSSFSGHQSHVCHLFQVTIYRSHVCQVRETDGKDGSALSANSMCAFAVFTVYFFSFMKNKKTNVTWPVNFDLSIDVWSCKWQLDYLRYNQPIIDAHGLDLLRSDGQQTIRKMY